jgi:hypothetical protein
MGTITKWILAFLISLTILGGGLWLFLFPDSTEVENRYSEKPIGPKSSTATPYITLPFVLGALGTHHLEINNEDLTIRLYKADSLKNPIQVFGPVKSDEDFKQPFYRKEPHNIFNEEDLNFDGYPDLKIPSIKGPNEIWYTVFIFNPSKKIYEEQIEISQQCNIRADNFRQELISEVIGRASNQIFSRKYFKWVQGEFKLIRIDRQDVVDENRLKRDLLVNIPNQGIDTMASILINIKNVPHIWCLRKGKWKYVERFVTDMGIVIKKEGLNEPCFIPDQVLKSR